jgi:hypothetical protein
MPAPGSGCCGCLIVALLCCRLCCQPLLLQSIQLLLLCLFNVKTQQLQLGK